MKSSAAAKPSILIIDDEQSMRDLLHADLRLRTSRLIAWPQRKQLSKHSSDKISKPCSPI